ncbi:VWA domain-containing protein [Flavobacteriaceae bacterium F08102]|nr:VWA domain-containing protein [Flavobacteriaceae bacterium F08102]
MTTETILLLLLAVVIASLVSYFQYYYKAKKRTNETLVLASLRFLSVFVLLVLLINPQLITKQLIDVKPILNIAVDNSRSIAYSNSEDQVKATLKKIRENNALNEKYNVNYYSFGANLNQLDSLSFSISQTNIIHALESLNEVYRNDLAPIVMLSDGNQNYGNDYTFYDSKQPVFPVIVGDTTHYEDLKINQLNVNAYTNLHNHFPVEVFLQYEGKQKVTKQFTIRHGMHTVYSTMLSFSPEQNTQHIQVNLPANSTGLKHFVAHIAELDAEHNTINNSSNFSIEVIDEQAKILLLSHMKHPDLGMLKRSIETNELVKVVIEDDLTKGLNINDYQMVILYQPTVEFTKVFETLNKTKTNVFYITGLQTDWTFLNQNQPYFSKNTSSTTEEFGAEFNLEFDEFIIKDIDFASFAPLKGAFGQISFKQPFKTILFQRIETFSTKDPLLSTFTVDGLRGAVLFGEGIWKWRMLTEIEQKSPVAFDEFLHKIIQYLSSTKRAERLEVHFDPIVYSNGLLKFNAYYYDANYVFDPSGELHITITNQSNKNKRTIPFALKNNTFALNLGDLDPGTYHFTVDVKGQKIQKSGYFRVLDYDIEQQLSTSNSQGLLQLATTSEGKAYSIDQVDQLIDNLVETPRFRTVQYSKETLKSLIEIGWLLSLLIVLFSLEWLIRKYRGLI